MFPRGGAAPEAMFDLVKVRRMIVLDVFDQMNVSLLVVAVIHWAERSAL